MSINCDSYITLKHAYFMQISLQVIIQTIYGKQSKYIDEEFTFVIEIS